MTAPCCLNAHRLARRFSSFTASILPTAVLVFLPKCPLCLAAWLTVATGVSFSAAAAAWLRTIMVLLYLAALTSMICRHALGRAAEPRCRARPLEQPTSHSSISFPPSPR